GETMKVRHWLKFIFVLIATIAVDAAVLLYGYRLLSSIAWLDAGVVAIFVTFVISYIAMRVFIFLLYRITLLFFPKKRESICADYAIMVREAYMLNYIIIALFIAMANFINWDVLDAPLLNALPMQSIVAAFAVYIAFERVYNRYHKYVDD
ncbi:hypothetical protein LJC55_02560, partial [Eubacteriales bacterium OttesenSCG-928-N14]|nr:hypothetical protein [Eubacteriales bacterium OttesenSCG-928-N14]